jgi:molybdopterin synthase catalytic subunit
MAVTLVFLGKLADLADAPERDVAGPLDWQGLLAALPGPLGEALQGEKVKLAVNATVLADKTALAAVDGDEVALLPPVSGGCVKDIRILHGELSPGNAMTAFAAAHPEAGGIVAFVGKVRPDRDVEELELRHYAPLTLRGMEELADTTLARWSLEGVLLHHRTGAMRPGDPIVLVAAAARHRRAAFEAADFAMDHLKSDAWFWKREKRGGEWRWIDPRAEDHADLRRWSA